MVRLNQALPCSRIRGHDRWMSQTKKFDFSKTDSIFAVFQLLWDRGSAFVASAAGAAVMGALAKATAWVSAYGPIAWGLIGLTSFAALYALMIWGRKTTSASRRDRANALVAERAAEFATVNPLAPHFVNQRIRLSDLHSPFGEPLRDRTFSGCDLIGPAVILLSHMTVYRGNIPNNVEYIRVNGRHIQMWPNKLTIIGGTIENCRLYNVIFVIPEDFVGVFEGLFIDDVPWANDPPINTVSISHPGEVSAPPSPQGIESERPR